jgi:hypothetical protein
VWRDTDLIEITPDDLIEITPDDRVRPAGHFPADAVAGQYG